MKENIVTCINTEHPVYKENFKNNNIKSGKAYMCVDELFLTSPSYYLPEYSLLEGITIKSHVGRYGWVKSCLPKVCFRLATESEKKRYKFNSIMYMPFRYMKILFFKVVHRIDRIVRSEYYKKLNEEYFLN